MGIMIGREETHLLEPTFRSLEKQEFKDFEFILADCLYTERTFPYKPSFPVQHLNVQSPLLDAGYVDSITPKNMGAKAAEGGLLIFIDDCSEFPDPEWLDKIYQNSLQDRWVSSLGVYYEAGKPKPVDGAKLDTGTYSPDSASREQKWSEVHSNGEFVRDSRYKALEDNNASELSRLPGNCFYGYTAVPKKAFVAVNGYNQALAGVLAFEDNDLGLRLERAYGRRVYISKDIWHIEHWHREVNKRFLVHTNNLVKCAYGLSLWNEVHGYTRVNEHRWTMEMLNHARANLCPSRCFNYKRCLGERLAGQFYHDSPELDFWLKSYSLISQ